MDDKFRGLVGDVVEVGRVKASFADWTGPMFRIPELDAFLAELVTTDCQSPVFELALANGTDS